MLRSEFEKLLETYRFKQKSWLFRNKKVKDS